MCLAYTIGTDGLYRAGSLVVGANPGERMLAYLYYAFEAQGLLEVIFHEGDKPSLLWFLNTYLDPAKSTVICYRVDTTGEFGVGDGRFFTPIGMAWFNGTWKIGTNFCKSETGMAFVRKIPVEDTVSAAKMFIAWAFNTLAIDSLIGMTPAPNRAAVIFGQRVGFTQAGPVHGYTAWRGKLCSAVVSSMTRAQWMEIHQREMRVVELSGIHGKGGY